MKNEILKVRNLWVTTIIIWVLVFVMMAMKSCISHATSLDKQTVFQHNGQEFQTGSVIYQNRVFVPLRMLSEKLGYKVSWISQDKTITISNFWNTASFKLGSKNIYINGEDMIKMDVEPLIIDGLTFIPVRYAVESLGKYIELYDSTELRIINITDNKPTQEVNR